MQPGAHEPRDSGGLDQKKGADEATPSIGRVVKDDSLICLGISVHGDSRKPRKSIIVVD